MELIFRICLFLAGIINILPSILMFLPQKLADSYGINIPDADYELLLRHRAVLFGIIGGIMIYSALSKEIYSKAVIIGLISMVSFIVLYFVVDGEVNSNLRKVMIVDIIGVVILLVGFGLYKFS